VSIDKYKFHKSDIEFRGYLVSDTDITMAQDKVKTVLEWEGPKWEGEVHTLMGFANCYYGFIKALSKLGKPLTVTTSEQFKGKNWQGSDLGETAIEAPKQRFTMALVLGYHDPKLPILGEADGSDFAIGAVL
jgi:hypothetical protein